MAIDRDTANLEAGDQKPIVQVPRQGGQAGRIEVLLVFAALSLALLVAVYLGGERYFLREAAERGRTALSLHVGNLRGWLGSYQALPQIYATSPALTALLQTPQDPALKATANDFLVAWNLASGAADSYLLDVDGTAVAASNWDEPTSFVDKNYSFRPYYKLAMEGVPGQFFGLGTVSGKRGYYFSYPVRHARQVIGVAVVKAGVDAIEAAWRDSPEEVFVTDANGIVVLAKEPGWRMTTLNKLSDEALAHIAKNRQFKVSKLQAMPLHNLTDEQENKQGGPPLVEIAGAQEHDGEYLFLTQPLPGIGWQAHLLVDTSDALRQTEILVILAAILLLALGLVALVLRERRLRYEERLAAKEEARDRLERAVARRTYELRLANRSLEQEVGERRQAEADLRQTQTELIQAGKLAALGQMSAALSHEFNQPLTAIRTYAENAIALFQRGRQDEAEGNMRQVTQLTEQMAGLSKHLSRFARKPKIVTRPVALKGVLTESLSLLKGRLEKQEVAVKIDLPLEELWIVGGHIRLQQVIVNLLTNALDAMQGLNNPVLNIAARQVDERVFLTVSDIGDGIEPAILEKIFDPFVTTKDVGQGLGLGLSISFNIIKDFGGSLTAQNRSEGGACFTVELAAASPASDLDREKGAE